MPYSAIQYLLQAMEHTASAILFALMHLMHVRLCILSSNKLENGNILKPNLRSNISNKLTRHQNIQTHAKEPIRMIWAICKHKTISSGIQRWLGTLLLCKLTHLQSRWTQVSICSRAADDGIPQQHELAFTQVAGEAAAEL